MCMCYKVWILFDIFLVSKLAVYIMTQMHEVMKMAGALVVIEHVGNKRRMRILVRPTLLLYFLIKECCVLLGVSVRFGLLLSRLFLVPLLSADTTLDFFFNLLKTAKQCDNYHVYSFSPYLWLLPLSTIKPCGFEGQRLGTVPMAENSTLPI